MEDKEAKGQEELRKILASENLMPGLAHKLSNHLSPVIGYAQRLLLKTTDPEVTEDLKKIIAEAQQASQIIKDLVSFLKKTKPNKEILNINGLIEEILEIKSRELTVKRIKVVKEFSYPLPLTLADPNQLRQVILDLINNAEEAIAEFHGFGTIMIRTVATKGQIEIIISDDGPGISEENLPKIFDPFFTTKKKGVGLGLTNSYDILTQHEGTMKVESEWGKGTTLRLTLPIIENQAVKKKEAEKNLEKSLTELKG